MALDTTIFQALDPARFLTFTLPNPTNPTHLLRVAVLDSPLHPTTTPRVAALLVPPARESDWVFSTEPGHLQLLLSSSPPISRLILIGDNPINGPDPPTAQQYKPVNTQYAKTLIDALKPLFIGLSLRKSVQDWKFCDVPLLDYEDNVVSSLVLERCVGEYAGEMLVEDVEIEIEGKDSELGEGRVSRREFRRRLRFKRMPNLVQTEIRVIPEERFGLDGLGIGGGVRFMIDLEVLVHSYLVPMVAGLSLIVDGSEDRLRCGFRPKALCLGVGGGALLGFLRNQLKFDVVGVEMDEEVLRVAREYFGLGDCGVQVCVGDAMEFVKRLAGRGRVSKNLLSSEVEEDCCFGGKFDVIMVDLDSSDAGSGVSAPPLEFMRKDVLLAARSILSDSGILVLNVIPLSRAFFDSLIDGFREIFNELYEIDVGNEENFVLIARMSSVVSSVADCKNSFLDKLRVAISGSYLDSIRKI